jgi:hypothetical protein
MLVASLAFLGAGSKSEMWKTFVYNFIDIGNDSR